MAEAPSPFQDGKVYAIRNSENNEVYVGSTIRTLEARLAGHQKASRRNGQRECRLLNEMIRQVGEDKFTIELLEAYPCDIKRALHVKEREWVERLASLNLLVPARTHAERHVLHREENNQRSKTYYYEHREECLERVRLQGPVHRDARREEICLSNAQYRQDHREERKAWASEVIQCECGSSGIRSTKARHEKSLKHKAYIASLAAALDGNGA